jgi:hypothetical protein
MDYATVALERLNKRRRTIGDGAFGGSAFDGVEGDGVLVAESP